MPLFDLGSEVRLVRELRAGPARAFELSRQVVRSYESLGFSVALREEQPPERLVADVTDAQGTRITARVELAPAAPGTRLEIQLQGRIQVGGVQGMFATEGKVRSVAREKLAGLLDRTFAGVGPDPAPAPAPAPAAAPSGRSAEARLAVLKQLFDKGLISAEDLRRKKQEILTEL